MTLLSSGNARMALQSIRSNRLRSMLTMIGIIIGVASVITAVSLGEGVRRQVASSAKNVSPGVITVRPGRLVERGQNGKITKVNYLAAISSDSLTEEDMQSIGRLPSTKITVPLGTISALPTTQEGRTHESTVIGTTADFASLVKQRISYGEFFTTSQSNRNVAVIGKTVAEQLFQENVPVGQAFYLRGQEFVVGGVFDTFESNALTDGGNLNNAIFIPYNVAQTITNRSINIYQALVQPTDVLQSSKSADDITKQLTKNHGGQIDFTVLKDGETLTLAGKTIALATSFIAGIAAISLIVGGIGIMNIMFVSVTERTREIGVRKSLGATNRQIYGQFLIEATVLSIVGGFSGIVLGLVTNFLLRVLTNLRPFATLPIIAVAMLASTTIGVIFGTVPAIKAARKDPIEALRYE